MKASEKKTRDIQDLREIEQECFCFFSIIPFYNLPCLCFLLLLLLLFTFDVFIELDCNDTVLHWRKGRASMSAMPGQLTLIPQAGGEFLFWF